MSQVDIKATGYVNFVKEDGGRTEFLLGLSRKKKDGTYEKGTLSCVAWSDCSGSIVKGERVTVEGYGFPEEWERDGKKQSKFKVTAKKVSPPEEREVSGKLPGKSPPPAAKIELGDDPF